MRPICEHLHLCLVHPPQAMLGLAALLVAAVAAVLVLVRAVPGLVRLLRARRVLARLRSVSVVADPPDVRSVDSDAVFSFTGGLLHPDIYLSRGLREQLRPAQLAAVLAHGRAHVRRRDMLRRHLAQLGALLHGPATARALLSALELACEEACDAEAATTLGDRAEVAQAIVAVARLKPGLQPPPSEATPSRWLLAGAFVALVVLAPALHHATETVLLLYLGAGLGLALYRLVRPATRDPPLTQPVPGNLAEQHHHAEGHQGHRGELGGGQRIAEDGHCGGGPHERRGGEVRGLAGGPVQA